MNKSLDAIENCIVKGGIQASTFNLHEGFYASFTQAVSFDKW